MGLPFSHAIATAWNWQTSFVALGVVGLIIALFDIRALPALPAVSAQTSADDMQQFRSPRLWGRYLVSLLTIGATYGAFSYFTPLLEEDAGFSSNATTVALFGYGLCTVIGNNLVGRYADRHAVTLLRIGHLALTGALVVLAIFSEVPWAVLPGVLVVGLVGVSMNPALVARVVEVAGAGGLVNTVHTSVITLGVVAGSAIGGVAISTSGDTTASAAMWTGAILAVLATVVLSAQTVDRKRAHCVQVQPAQD
ncbi:MFS transporter [Streptomyces capoamus]|uniref:MFS transporter n=1 Tax=Streptomyces capoamus TaxID=68183 RepID=UPI0033990260